MIPFDLIAAICGATGAIILAWSGPRAAWGWPLFLASNIGWIAHAMLTQQQPLLWQTVVFTATSILGIIRGLLWPWARKRLLAIPTRRDPDFIVGGAEYPYLRRWWVIPRNRAFNIYLHEFLRSDDDRALHDHPWTNLSILLDGAYIEHQIAPGGIHTKRTMRAGDWRLRLSGRQAHRIEISCHLSSRCYTLFITGPVYRDWGFHCPAGWVPWQRFVDDKDKGAIGHGCGD